MNLIASDEPDQVGVVPKPITFWYRGKRYDATVASSALKPQRIAQQFSTVIQLRDDFGRAWLTDPCSMILQESMHARAMTRSEDRKREREIQRRLKGMD